MIRVTIREQVIYGHFREYMSVWEEMTAHGKAQGWADWRLYSPVSGVQNEVVVQADFDSLADYETESRKIQGDTAFVDLLRKQAPHVVQGSSVSEILETVGDIA